jgi:hypothetical protein
MALKSLQISPPKPERDTVDKIIAGLQIAQGTFGIVSSGMDALKKLGITSDPQHDYQKSRSKLAQTQAQTADRESRGIYSEPSLALKGISRASQEQIDKGVGIANIILKEGEEPTPMALGGGSGLKEMLQGMQLQLAGARLTETKFDIEQKKKALLVGIPGIPNPANKEGLWKARTAKLATEFRKTSKGNRKALGAVGSLEKIRDRLSAMPTGKYMWEKVKLKELSAIKKAAATAVIAIKGGMRIDSTGGGNMSWQEQIMLEQLASNPSKFFTTIEASSSGLAALRSMLERDMYLSAYEAGIKIPVPEQYKGAVFGKKFADGTPIREKMSKADQALRRKRIDSQPKQGGGISDEQWKTLLQEVQRLENAAPK